MTARTRVPAGPHLHTALVAGPAADERVLLLHGFPRGRPGRSAPDLRPRSATGPCRDLPAPLGRTAAEGTGAWIDADYRFEVLHGAGHRLPDAHADRVDPLLLAHLAAHPAFRR
ncbi:hypothetical protein [Streptomyces sp. NPDC001594]|uniref:hypothetical protein n=1 Tax=Streptomyces sp. NPDC001594 TaxID=3364590 RepID=UPI0036AF0247